MVEPIRILILEDVPADAALVERELRHAGLEFVARRAESEPEFLAALDAFKPHVILSDYTLPSFDGMAALRLARERVPATPFIIVTGTLSEEIAVECIQAGADDYVLKDRLTRLPAAVRAAIERRRLEEDKRRAEEALNASEEKYRRILENMDESYFEVDLAGNLTFFNESLCRLLGYPRDELMGMNNRKFTDKEHTKKVFQTFNKIFTTGESAREFDWEVIKKDGTKRHVETSASLRTDSSGQSIGFAGLFRDITERKRAEEELRESEERFRQLTETMPDAVVVGQDGRNVYANSAAARMLRAGGPEELVGLEISTIVDPAQYERARQQIQRALAGEMPPPFEDSFVRLDGSLVPVEIAVSLLTWQGRPALQIVARDITDRKRAEQELRNSKQVIEGILNAIPVRVFWKDKNLVYLGCNAIFARDAGFADPKDLIGKDDYQMGWRDQAELYRGDDREVIESGCSKILKEEPQTTPEGNTITLLTSKLPLRDSNGEITGLLGTYMDITERKRAEQAFRESEERYRTLVAHSPDGIFLVDLKGNFLSVNETICHELGFSEAEMLAMTLWDIVPEGQWETHKARLARILKGESLDETVEYSVRNKAGQLVPVEVRSAPYRKGEEIVGFQAIARNITERKLADEALRATEARYRLIAENTADVIWTLDLATRRMTYVSPSVERLRGFTAEEVLAQPFEASLTPDSLHRVDAYLAAALAAFAAGDQSAKTGTVEADMPTKDGGIVQTEIVATALTDASGRATGVLGVTRNITKRKRAEKALRESEERFRTLYENSPIGLYRTTPDGRILMANRTFVDMLGYASFDELASRNLNNVDDFRPTYPRERFLEAIERNGEVKGMEAAWKQADGSMVFIRESARAVHDAEGNTLYYDGSVENITERRRAEEALRASEELYKLIMASVSDGIFAVDTTGRFTFASPRALEITGYRQDEVVGYHFNEVLGSEAQIRASEMFELSVAGKEVPLSDIGITTKGGRILPIELSMSTLRAADGNLVGWVGVFRDVTERTKAQAALKASEKKYRTLFDAADDAILIFEPEGETILEANPRACQLYGFSREELIGTSLKKLTVDVSRGERQLADLIHDGVLRNFESVYLRRDGSHIPVLINAKVIEFEGREAALALIRDMTEQRRAEQELRLRGSALEAAANAIFITNTEGTIQWANPAFTWLTGYSLDEVRGENPRILKSGAQDRATYQELWRTITSGAVWHGELVNRRKDGTLYSEEMTITPVRDALGTIAHFIAVKQDISARQQAEAQRKRLEEILRQSQKMDAVGQLAGGVAHDFNNLLQAMLNLSQFLVAHCTDPERVAADAAELEQQVKHGAALTRQLLLFSRRETARLETLDLNEVIREAGKLLRRLLKANITIEQRLAEGKLPVVADRGQIEQVLFNLAVNSADAMPQGGRLVITTGSDASTVWLQVADTGGGIPAEIRQRIFEPFFTTKGEGSGTGLGLAVVHGIVAQHSGRIACESHEGQGTTFTITLPRGGSGEFVALKVKGQEDEATAGRGERVLIVEDEASARDSLAEILTVLGYEVVAVGSGEEAGLLPSEPAFKVLLTDIMLPGIAGADLARGLLERWPELKVILMSGYTEDEAMRKGISASPVRFLQKPFGMSALARELRNALDEAPAAGD